MRPIIIRNALAILAFFLACNVLAKLDPVKVLSNDEVFITGPIGNYILDKRVTGHMENPSETYGRMGSMLVNYFYKYHQSIFYDAVYNNSADGDQWHLLITPTKNDSYIKQGVLLYVAKNRPQYLDFTDNTTETNSNTWQIREINGKPYLLLLGQLYKGKKSVSIYWQSENIIVHISNQSPNPFNSTILAPYLQKYPPTWELSQEDLKPELLIRNEITFALDTITKELDPKRSWGKAVDKFEPILYQCYFEKYVRSMVQDGQTGCPITLEMNNLTRKFEWDRFQKQALYKKFEPDKINFKSLFDYKYQEDDPAKTIANKLGLEMSDIPPEYYLPYYDWPSIRELRKTKDIPEPK